MRQKLTPWFSLEASPTRPGVYELRDHQSVNDGWKWAYFDGEVWAGVWWSVEQAYENQSMYFGWLTSADEPEAKWRGIAK